MKIGGFSTLSDFLSEQKSAVNACFVDTSILFSETYPLDRYNSDSEIAFEALSDHSISIFTNQNVRSEFLENHRRVLFAESLIDFFEDHSSSIPSNAAEKLKSHRTSFRRKVDEGRDSKLNANQLKDFRDLLVVFDLGGKSAWMFLCENYLGPRLAPLWDSTVSELRIHSLTSRANEVTPYLKSKLDWNDAVKLMCKYGIASADAMILNMFLSSTIPLLITADVEMAQCVRHENRADKIVFLPDSLA